MRADNTRIRYTYHKRVLVSKVKITKHSVVFQNSKKTDDHMIVSRIRLPLSGMGLKRIQDENTLIVGKIICTLRQADVAILELMADI